MGYLIDNENSREELEASDEASKLEKESERKGSFHIKTDCQERVLSTMVDRDFQVSEGILSSIQQL